VEEIVPVPSRNDERRAAMDVVARFGAPAYLRRAKRVETVFTDLIDRLRVQRDDWLRGVRLQLGLLLSTAGTLEALRGQLPDDNVASVRAWVNEFGLTEGRATGAGPWRLRRAVRDLADSVTRFNRRWGEHVNQTVLSDVNAERDGYNRWYVLEKECAVGVVRARQAFRPLPHATHADVLAALPLLPELPAV